MQISLQNMPNMPEPLLRRIFLQAIMHNSAEGGIKSKGNTNDGAENPQNTEILTRSELRGASIYTISLSQPLRVSCYF